MVSILFVLLLSYFSLSHTAQAVVPPPDGGYPNFTTAEGSMTAFIELERQVLTVTFYLDHQE